MIDNTMPERIYAGRILESIRFELAPHKLEGINTEYIRADLALGDASEPLADGQYRWVRLSKDESFIPATIHKDALRKGRLIYFICGNEMEDYVEDCYEWGPVIRPPDDA